MLKFCSNLNDSTILQNSLLLEFWLYLNRASTSSLESLITDLKIVLLQKSKHAQHECLTAVENTHCPYATQDTFSKKDMSC